MKKILISICCILAFLGSSGFHIVGGEIEFITLAPGQYRINLIQYFDEAQEDNPSPDGGVLVYLFSNKDGALIRTISLPLVEVTPVPYTNFQCAIEELETSRVLYSLDLTLDPEEFADEEGYYLVWERCCRNSTIVNIINPVGTGMKYLLDIPPLWKDGAPFINSSPELLKPLSDYACVGQLYYTSFTGSDRDGDSLVYKLATPLNSSSSNPLPIPKPKPSFNVQYEEGYSLTNMIPGNPPLRISGRGLLTVNPSKSGLYVFSVIVEEWRDGRKIGQIQRDFQMLAISEGCNPPDPPDVGVKIPGDDDFSPQVDVLQYEVEDNKCFDFYVTNLSAGENITFRVDPVNFTAGENWDSIFSVNTLPVDNNQDTLIVEVCVPGCPPVRNGPFIIDLIAGDDACPLPQLDTVRLTIEVEPPPNIFPQLSGLQSAYTIDENTELRVPVSTTDADEDFIVPQILIADGTDPATVGMSFQITTNESGLLESEFIWETNCREFDFSEDQSFRVGIVMEDQDVCDLENDEVYWVDLEVVLPPNTDPEVSIASADSVSVLVGETIIFDVSALDADQDRINLYLETPGFSAGRVGATFEPAFGIGEAESPFSWQVTCEQIDLNQKSDFVFHFIADDEDHCSVKNYDTLTFQVHVEAPPNSKPQFKQYVDTVLHINQPFELDIIATDADGDLLTLGYYEGIRRPPSSSLLFESAVGEGTVASTLSWTPECDLLDFGQTSAFYDLAFLVYDDACPASALDTVQITFEVQETRESFDRFTPPNVFTPNDDGKNDTYTLTNLTNPAYNLPSDNCDDSFQFISIYDRSGKTVYETDDREFVWDGDNVPAGTYYYFIKYTRTEYKGYLQVLK